MQSFLLRPLFNCNLLSGFGFHKFWSLAAIWFFLFIVILPIGCAAPTRVAEFQQFAEAGNKYTAATVELTNEAGTAAINADSVTLIKSRNLIIPKGKLTPDKINELNKELQNRILTQNKSMLEYLNLMGKIRLHLKLLQDYFNALSALAASNAPSGIGQAAQSAVNNLGTLSPQIKNAKIDNISVSQFTGAVVPIVVAKFQQAALEKELRTRAPVLERELDLSRPPCKP